MLKNQEVICIEYHSPKERRLASKYLKKRGFRDTGAIRLSYDNEGVLCVGYGSIKYGRVRSESCRNCMFGHRECIKIDASKWNLLKIKKNDIFW